jgi:penicillin-binding protein 1A
MKVAHGSYCGDFAQPTTAFVSSPFFGTYATSGVKGNKVDPSTYSTNSQGATALETGKGKQGNGNGKGGSKYPADQYASPPQGAPNTQTPQGTTPAQTPQGATPPPAAPPAPGGGTTAPDGTGAPPP